MTRKQKRWNTLRALLEQGEYVGGRLAIYGPDRKNGRLAYEVDLGYAQCEFWTDPIPELVGELHNESLWMPPYCTWGDYSGSTIERSNQEALLKDFKGDWLLPVHGGYGTASLAVNVSRWLVSNKADQFLAVIERFKNNCLYDEAHHSYLEVQLQNESWDNGVVDDYRIALRTSAPDDLAHTLLNLITDERLRQIFEVAAEQANEYWHCEDAVSAFIRLDPIVEVTWDTMLSHFAAECEGLLREQGVHPCDVSRELAKLTEHVVKHPCD